MVGRGLRPFPGKIKLRLIDCVGVTATASLRTAPTLLRIDLSSVPEDKACELEGDLFDLPELAIRAADCPQSWIRNVKIVDLWAKEQMGVEPHTALSHMDWREISPIMDVHYRTHHKGAPTNEPQNDATPELPPNYKKIYNNKGQLTYAAVDTEGFFADKPEYWVK